MRCAGNGHYRNTCLGIDNGSNCSSADEKDPAFAREAELDPTPRTIAISFRAIGGLN
jgi:hypothetical protein